MSSSSALLHQFDTAEQQKDASTLGMWVFLVTEIMFFGGMFTAYIVYRTLHPAGFVEASHELNLTLGAINTAVLICSSLTMVLAVNAAQMGSSRNLIAGYLSLTILLGLVFLGIKAAEYYEKFVDHHVPGPSFHFDGPHAANAQLFFSLYFAMTGLHALHMIIGIVLVSILAIRAHRGRFSPEYYTPIDMTGLYWHFVDIIWIFLFPLLYLLGGHLRGGP